MSMACEIWKIERAWSSEAIKPAHGLLHLQRRIGGCKRGGDLDLQLLRIGLSLIGKQKVKWVQNLLRYPTSLLFFMKLVF